MIVSRESPVRTAKHVALTIGFRAGFLRLAQLVRRQQALILTFHRFCKDGQGSPRGLPIQRFAEYMKYLARRYRLVSLRELTRELGKGVNPSNTAVVTLDDGYDDVLSLAVPVLRRFGIPASIFVVSDFIDHRVWPWPDQFSFVFDRAPRHQAAFRHRGAVHVLELGDAEGRRRTEERWREYAKTIPTAERDELLGSVAEACGLEIPNTPPPEYRPMTWMQLRALAAEGFDVGAHTRTHPILSQVGPKQLRDEIGGCKEQIEANIRGPVVHFAYPNGRRQDYTPDVVAAVAGAGYTAAVTTIPGANTAGTPIFELRRIDATTEDLPHFAQAVSGVELLRNRSGSG
jgi:peptidoglycan/xylan/chitin deacetylase (PgdA/CDA1 family)